jgi:hypothetical protein
MEVCTTSSDISKPLVTYYSEYDTGTFKCCTTVYGAPGRDYHFDVLFLNPANLPPGTPMFQDIVNLSYQQSFKPQ